MKRAAPPLHGNGPRVNRRQQKGYPMHRRCVNACRPPFGWRGKPCEVCAENYEEAMDESLALYRLGNADVVARRALPATDREWEEHLDSVAPVVTTANDLTFYFTT